MKYIFSVFSSYLIVFWKAIVVKTGKDECFVEGLTVRNLDAKEFLSVLEKLMKLITCLKENVSLKKGFRVFLWTFVSNFRFLSGIRYTWHDHQIYAFLSQSLDGKSGWFVVNLTLHWGFKASHIFYTGSKMHTVLLP